MTDTQTYAFGVAALAAVGYFVTRDDSGTDGTQPDDSPDDDSGSLPDDGGLSDDGDVTIPVDDDAPGDTDDDGTIDFGLGEEYSPINL